MREFTRAKNKHDSKELLAFTFKGMKRIIRKSLQLRDCEDKQRAKLTSFTKRAFLRDSHELLFARKGGRYWLLGQPKQKTHVFKSSNFKHEVLIVQHYFIYH